MAYAHLYPKKQKYCFLHTGPNPRGGGIRFWFSYKEEGAIDVPETHEVIIRSDGWPQIRRKPRPFGA